MDPKPSNTTKVARIALDAHELAAAGIHPPDAWIQVLKRVYAGKQLDNQIQHTCPKWAFSGLCVFGAPASEGYPRPNDEVDVLLGLWEAQLVVPT